MTISRDLTPKKSECRIAEIVQHTCHLAPNRRGEQIMQCFPILRIFRLCKGQPAVEITKFVNVDPKDGGIEIPAGFRTKAIQARPWREVIRYDHSDGLDDLQYPGSRSPPTV
ncbi:hypothetical protein BDN70DRAFT_883350 [Pholiota conissans]|uniref:Uncharacterized protein n=1 Tax=Pholiota conissans TaxID=109636 RepID=A0A9P5YW91_9AGAR|nr:hypothetical protein BDN70DRAFT_883350 [Pholiota conissans]